MAMKMSWMLPAAVLVTAFGASAAPIPCVSSTLASYTALGMGCSIDSTVFTGFTAAGSLFGAPIDPSAVLVTPIQAGDQRGFRFDLDQTADAGEAFGILIGYSISFAVDASVQLNGSSVTPDGVNTAVLNLCSGDYDASGPTGCTGTESALIAFDDGVSAQLLESLGLTSGAYDVFLDVVVDGGLNGGGASLDSVTALTSVPEPGTWFAVVSGLAMAAGYRKNRLNRRNNE